MYRPTLHLAYESLEFCDELQPLPMFHQSKVSFSIILRSNERAPKPNQVDLSYSFWREVVFVERRVDDSRDDGVRP